MSSPRDKQQAFVFRNAYALQFHLEVTPTPLAEWGAVPAYAGTHEHPGRGDDLQALVEQVRTAVPASVELARKLFRRWLVHAVGVPR